MHIRRLFPGLLAALIGWSVAIYTKSVYAETAATSDSQAISPGTIARVHWVGKRRLGVEAGAYNLMRIWSLPESVQLEAQTLNKLATVPWRLKFGEAAAANAPGGFLRPLLDDVVREESWLEIRQTTGPVPEIVFAIKLDEQRAGLWRTNLAGAVASLTGIQTMQVEADGWSFENTDPPERYELHRVDGWTLLGVAPGKNSLLADVIARVSSKPSAVPDVDSSDWLQFNVDAALLGNPLQSATNLPGGLPKISVSVNGDGANVITHGELSFPQSLPIELEPWHLPANRIHDPLTSFTAIRGFKLWLESWKVWNSLQIGCPSPNEAFFWSLDGVRMQICLAVPMADASNQVHAVAGTLLERANPWLTTHDRGSLEYNPGLNAMAWTGLRSLVPTLYSRSSGEDSFVVGGLVPGVLTGTNTLARVYDCPQFSDLITDFSLRTNLVYYDWELTAARAESDLYLGQIVRGVLGGAQLPTETAAMTWLGSVKARLANSTTVMTYAGPDHLSFYRKSTLGFTGAELHLLADWLESPAFPRGLHTTYAPPDVSSQQ